VAERRIPLAPSERTSLRRERILLKFKTESASIPLMLKKNIKIHDKYQFEIKLNYNFNRNQKKTAYKIDTFFFIPYSLGINRHTYSKTIFYKDIQNYIRLKTPTMLLKQITHSENSPLSRLRSSVHTLVEKRDKESRQHFELQVKMVGSITKSALRDHVSFIKKSSLDADIPCLIEEFITESRELLKKYRELWPLLNVPTISEKSQAIFRFGDEFLSTKMEANCFRLLKFLEKTKSGAFSKLRTHLIHFIQNESEYRIAHNFPVSARTEYEKEELIYRRGVLKKYIGSALFLETARTTEGKFMDQVIMGMAAGMAMVFATLVAFFAQIKFGNLTMPLFALLVFSYIFKDRFKELARTYFVSKLRKFRFDLKTAIFSDERKKLGIFKDGVNFVDEAHLPETIVKTRKKEHITDVENRWRGEEVIYYKKHVTLYAKQLKKVFNEYDIEGVNDIIRFNVFRFLNKMDSPSKRVYSLENGHMNRMSCDRVYHMNLIIKISRDEKILLYRYRIILNRDGIKRIEKVNTE